MTLNPSQLKAVVYQGDHLLITAGPGTGKTHTLTQRILKDISALPSGEKVLAITFTNKAALEMQHRLVQQSADMSKIFVGTFHSFCLQFLRQHYREDGLPADVQVASTEEVESLTKELWPQHSVSQRRDLLQRISRWKSVEFLQPFPEQVTAYNKFLRQHKRLDFDDLLLEALKLMSFNPSLLKETQETYRHIFVDEYQDINPLQHTLLKALAGPGVTLTVIGDPNQAIYGFRGSDVRFFESFRDDFPGAENLSLQDNYRSAQNLLTASGQVMAGSRFAYLSGLNAQVYDEGHLIIHESPTDKAEAEYVVHEVEKLVGGTSMFSHDSARVGKEQAAEQGFGDIAVLYRLNAQKNLLKEALERSGIPYEISGDKSVKEELLPRGDDKYQERSERVALMTVHASKGLEFPVVFIVGCEENILPLNIEGLTSDTEEERRLFYVGMTRAKRRLYLVRAQRRLLYGKTFENPPCPFLADIEEELKAYHRAQDRRRVKKEDNQLDLFRT